MCIVGCYSVIGLADYNDYTKLAQYCSYLVKVHLQSLQKSAHWSPYCVLGGQKFSFTSSF